MSRIAPEGLRVNDDSMGGAAFERLRSILLDGAASPLDQEATPAYFDALRCKVQAAIAARLADDHSKNSAP